MARCPLGHLASSSWTDRGRETFPGLSVSVQCGEDTGPTVCQALASTLFLSNTTYFTPLIPLQTHCQRLAYVVRKQTGTVPASDNAAPLRYRSAARRRWSVVQEWRCLRDRFSLSSTRGATVGAHMWEVVKKMWRLLPGNRIETNGRSPPPRQS